MPTSRVVFQDVSKTDLERREYEAVLASWLFERAPGQARLFSYICEKYLAGTAEDIKEFTVAAEVFGRSTEFDSRHDPIVRVNINRLRRALHGYYKTEGRHHPVQILIPVGRYVPVFRHLRGPVRAPLLLPTTDVEEGVDQTSSLPGRRRWLDSRQLVFSSGLALGLVFAVVSILLVWNRGFGLLSQDNARLADMIKRVDPSVRIMCGSTAPATLDQLGQVWVADTYFRGGVSAPVRSLASPTHPVYANQRVGRFSYRIPLPPGCYQLHLHFIETEERNCGVGGSSRLFDIILNGQTVARDFDIALQAGGCNLPLSRVFIDVKPASDGFLTIDFRRGRSWPTLSAIEIVPGTPGRMLAVRLVAQNKAHLAADRTVWRPDHYYKGGRAVVRDQTVASTSEPGLFKGERYGTFRYSIPVAPGRYTLKLMFAEAYFGSSNLGRGGVGARLFDVFCNGEAILNDFDIVKEAGGENRALVKSFSGVEPNLHGRLDLDFVSKRNNALVNAIEVVAE